MLLNVNAVLFVVIVAGAVNTNGTAMVRGFAPETVILLAICTELALVNDKLVNGVVPPTTSEKVTIPAVPARRTIAAAPFTVPEKLMLAPAVVAPAFVLSMVAPAVNATGPVKVTTPPPVVTLPLTDEEPV